MIDKINFRKELLIPSLALIALMLGWINYDYDAFLDDSYAKGVIAIFGGFYALRGVFSGISFLFPSLEKHSDLFFKILSIIVVMVLILIMLSPLFFQDEATTEAAPAATEEVAPPAETVPLMEEAEDVQRN